MTEPLEIDEPPGPERHYATMDAEGRQGYQTYDTEAEAFDAAIGEVLQYPGVDVLIVRHSGASAEVVGVVELTPGKTRPLFIRLERPFP